MNRVILHFKEEKKITLEKIKFFKHKEKQEINYICDIYGKFGYAKQENKSLDVLLKDLVWRILDDDRQAYEIVIVRTPKIDEMFQEIIHCFVSYGIKYRVIEERKTKNVIPILSGPKVKNVLNKERIADGKTRYSIPIKEGKGVEDI